MIIIASAAGAIFLYQKDLFKNQHLKYIGWIFLLVFYVELCGFLFYLEWFDSEEFVYRIRSFVIFPIIALIVYYPRYKPILFILANTAFLALYTYCLSTDYIESDVFLNSLNCIIMQTIISFMVYHFTDRSKIVLYLSSLFLILLICTLLFIETFNAYAPISYLLSDIFVLVLCFYFLAHLFKTEKDIFITYSNQFLTVCLIFSYYSSSIITTILIKQLIIPGIFPIYRLQLAISLLFLLGLLIVAARYERRLAQKESVSRSS